MGNSKLHFTSCLHIKPTGGERSEDKMNHHKDVLQNKQIPTKPIVFNPCSSKRIEDKHVCMHTYTHFKN